MAEDADSRIRAARRDLQALLDAELARLPQETTRARGAITRRIHELRMMLQPDYPYRSQAGQDLVVDRLLGHKRGGTFVDIGAYDGVTGSNSLFFEMWRGWTGILVEPVPAQRAKAEARRQSPCLPYAIAPTEGAAAFIAVDAGYTQMSGLAQSYDPALLARIRRDARHSETALQVPTRRLDSLLGEVGIADPDFISLDIEGGEIAVLSDFPFARHKVAFWAIENNTATPEIGRIMRGAGYELVAYCGADEIWRRRGLSA